MNEFSRIEDELYSLNSYVHLKFHSKITEFQEGMAKSYYNEYKTVKVGDYFFPCVEDLNQFINRLSDISEELSEDKEEYEV